jgi:hypothetical protein
MNQFHVPPVRPPVPTAESLVRSILLSIHDAETIQYHLEQALRANETVRKAVRSGNYNMALASTVAVGAAHERIGELLGRMTQAPEPQSAPASPCACGEFGCVAIHAEPICSCGKHGVIHDLNDSAQHAEHNDCILARAELHEAVYGSRS